MKKELITTDAAHLAEVRLVYRAKIKASERLQVTSSKDAFRIFFDSWDHDTIEHVEEFKLMLLNRSNFVLGIASLSRGGINGTVIDIRIVLQYALKTNASSIIICHNHPSCNLKPSDADTSLTRRIKESASLMDITLLDHLIITPEEKYFSIADELGI
jgi:DNA repair protein RadC